MLGNQLPPPPPPPNIYRVFSSIKDLHVLLDCAQWHFIVYGI